MRRRGLRLSCVLAAGIAASLSIPWAVSCQSHPSTKNPESTSTPARTPDGQPDLQGIWSFATITPLERPSDLASKEFLTDEEVTARDKDGETRHDRPPRKGDTGTFNAFWWDEGTTVATKRTSLIVDPRDGRLPPLTPEAAQKRAAMAEARRGVAPDTPTPGGWLEDLGPSKFRIRCLVSVNAGPPMIPVGYNHNLQIVQTAGYVVLLNEMIHSVRIVPLDGRPRLGAAGRQWSGESRGRWEGDTLIVDTTNFYGEPNWRFPGTSPDLHVIERFTRVDAETVIYEFTVEDPTVWTRPWTGQIPMKSAEGPIYEYACHEGNYTLPSVMAWARAEEAAQEKKKK